MNKSKLTLSTLLVATLPTLGLAGNLGEIRKVSPSDHGIRISVQEVLDRNYYNPENSQGILTDLRNEPLDEVLGVDPEGCTNLHGVLYRIDNNGNYALASGSGPQRRDDRGSVALFTNSQQRDLMLSSDSDYEPFDLQYGSGCPTTLEVAQLYERNQNPNTN